MDFLDGEKNIRNAAIAGLIVSVLTFLVGCVQTSYGIIAESVLILLLTWGVYYKSRICAVLLFILYLLDQLFLVLYPETQQDC